MNLPRMSQLESRPLVSDTVMSHHNSFVGERFLLATHKCRSDLARPSQRLFLEYAEPVEITLLPPQGHLDWTSSEQGGEEELRPQWHPDQTHARWTLSAAGTSLRPRKSAHPQQGREPLLLESCGNGMASVCFRKGSGEKRREWQVAQALRDPFAASFLPETSRVAVQEYQNRSASPGAQRIGPRLRRRSCKRRLIPHLVRSLSKYSPGKARVQELSLERRSTVLVTRNHRKALGRLRSCRRHV